MDRITVEECFCADNVINVLEEDRPKTINQEAIYAVFKDSTLTGEFCGLATVHDVSLHPDWIFADLCEHRPLVSVSPDAEIQQAIDVMNRHNVDVIPVLKESSESLLGVVTRASIVDSLLQKEHKSLVETKALNDQLECKYSEVLIWSERIEKLHEASRVLLGLLAYTSLDDTLLQAGIEALTQLLQAQYGAIGIVDPAGQLLSFIHTGMSPEHVSNIELHPEGRGLLGDIVDDMSKSSQAAENPIAHSPIKSLIAIPISRHGHLYGRIYLTDKLSGEPFTQDDETLARGFANSLSLVLNNAQEMEVVQKAKRDLDYIAHFDALTGLPNRVLFTDRMKQAVRHVDNITQSLAVLSLDLDNFKIVNDSLGHLIGDQLLVKFAQRLTACLSTEDSAARFGGDEFIILLPSIKESVDAAVVAQEILHSLKQPFIIDQHEVFITASIGIALYPDNAQDVDSLLSSVNVAMQASKSSGKNHYRFFDSGMNESVKNYVKLERHLRNAIKNNELELYYQPKVCLKTGSVVGVEALLRWNNCEHGLVSPDVFIPLAEEIGLIIPIGIWVINAACAQAKIWLEQGRNIRVSVNLSGRQFQHFDDKGDNKHYLFYEVVKALKGSGLPASLLELEITESIMMRHIAETLETLKKIKSLGVKISIDDFGTGYSSLSYLKTFPIDTLKIDKSFIDDIATDADDAAIVLAIFAMAKQLKLAVVAEGVETREQLNFLYAHDCQLVQGYYFGKPLPAEKLVFEEHPRELLYSFVNSPCPG